MKKVLFATTALVLTAGVAAAEVTVGGDGRMGVIYDGADWNFTSRIRIKFTASGETDGGLQFGGSARVDHYDTTVGSTASAANGAAGSVYISGAFGKITMGDVDSAAESAVGDVSGVGLTGLGDYNETLYVTSSMESGGDPHVLYAYTMGDLSFYASMSDGTGNTFDLSPWSSGAADQGYSIGVAYGMGDYSFGLGYERLDTTASGNVDHIIAGGSATFGGVTLKANYGVADASIGPDLDQYGVSADYTTGALSVTGYYTMKDAGTGNQIEAYGLGASYDLGGGASLKGGVVNFDSDPAGTSDTIGDFGVSFTF
ncbi:porin [Ostreiculturibacter nitratireducens]|uniref:porin n=1 Tax=Ostreiculturibacter nitratireducens TaxID=3075226 RepID=UPI0031B5C5D8